MRREIVASHIVEPAGCAAGSETVAGVLARLSRERHASVELVCVADPAGQLEGVVPVGRLFSFPGDAPLQDVMERNFPRTYPDTDQEAAASMALHHGVDTLPVVDRGGKLLGVMPSQSLMQVLRREHVEDLHKLAGIRHESARARHAIEDPPMRRARHRLPWLIFGLAGGAVATAAMAGFQATFERTIAAAFFVPALVYLADAIGTQSEAIAVRGLSLSRSGIGHLLAGEVRTGVVIGLTLGVLAYVSVWLAFEDPRLAGAVSVSIFVAGSIASGIGIGLPWWFARRGWDPAYGSGPVGTVIQDILTLLVYFLVLHAFGM